MVSTTIDDVEPDRPSLRNFDKSSFALDNAYVVSYLSEAFETGEVSLIKLALNNVARARGMTWLANETGLTREALYQALGEKGNPTLTSLLAISKALGVKLSIRSPADR